MIKRDSELGIWEKTQIPNVLYNIKKTGEELWFPIIVKKGLLS
jgi:hypothetical protein